MHVERFLFDKALVANGTAVQWRFGPTHNRVVLEVTLNIRVNRIASRSGMSVHWRADYIQFTLGTAPVGCLFGARNANCRPNFVLI